MKKKVFISLLISLLLLISLISYIVIFDINNFLSIPSPIIIIFMMLVLFLAFSSLMFLKE